MSIETQLEKVQMHIQRERQNESDLKKKLADAKDTKDVESASFFFRSDSFRDLMRFSQTLAALKQRKVPLQTQQGGDNR